ncbi:MAG: MarR family winged helix-turn-helix transcriptional regulator [Pseudomonadota bacterium]
MHFGADVSTPEKNQLRYKRGYLETLALIERLHRLLLDVIKDDFERAGASDVNAVQALLLYNIGDSELTAGELRSKGYYQGSNVSYNLKKMVELGYINHERCVMDRRAVRIKLTTQGKDIQSKVAALFERHIDKIASIPLYSTDEVASQTDMLRRLERFWSDQIRFIY